MMIIKMVLGSDNTIYWTADNFKTDNQKGSSFCKA